MTLPLCSVRRLWSKEEILSSSSDSFWAAIRRRLYSFSLEPGCCSFIGSKNGVSFNVSTVSFLFFNAANPESSSLKICRSRSRTELRPITTPINLFSVAFGRPDDMVSGRVDISGF